MKSLTAPSDSPQDLLITPADGLSTSHVLPLYDLRKPAGDKRQAQRMTVSDFFEQVNELAGDGTITGPMSNNPEAVTATVGGAAVPAAATFVTVTSSNASHIVVLPAPVIGKQVILQNGATGYELRTSSPSTISINGGSGASAQSAIPATTTVYMTCISLTAWKGFQQNSAGVVAAVEVAA
jgi:hypothetical protein